MNTKVVIVYEILQSSWPQQASKRGKPFKELFHLSGKNQLPYKGLAKVKPYLMMTSFALQLMMYYNYYKGVT